MLRVSNRCSSLAFVCRLGVLTTFLIASVSPSWATDTTTGESGEIQYSSAAAAELKSKATELATPVAIYQYVRNNYEFALYQGVRSGSINTFLGGRGNDVDLAATLIAMLRSQGIPARYAVGTVRVASSLVTNLLQVENTDLAYHLLRDQGIQAVVESADKSTLDFEHVWVEALIPYSNYRGVGGGAINCSTTPAACNWVSLDPSAKRYTSRSSGLDPYSNLSFDYTAYYSAIANNDATRRDKNPMEIYQEQVLAWLRSTAPGKTLEDIADFGDIVADESGLLPASLPYLVLSSVRRYNSAADHDAVVPTTESKKWTKTANVSISITVHPSGGGTVTINAGGGGAVALSQLAIQRLTLTTEIVGGIPNMVVRLGGTEIARPIQGNGTISGYTPAIGDPFTITVSMDGSPAPDSSTTDQVISATYNAIVGGYYLLATGGETSNWSQVHRAAQQLLDANTQYPIVFKPGESGCQAGGLGCTPYVDLTGNGWDSGDPRLLDDKPALDALTGGLLYVAGTQYYAKVRDYFSQADALNKIKTPISGFLGVVSTTYGVQFIDDTAFAVLPSGLLIDMKGISIAGSWRIDQPAAESDAQFTFLGHILSSLEHETWQELTGYDAISTVRGIQTALAGGATLVNPLKNQSTDTAASMFATFGFGTSAPSPFAIDVRSLYGTTPVTWTHPTTDSTQTFDVVERIPSSVSDSRRPRLTYANNFLDSNLSCFITVANQLQALLNSNGPNAQLNAGTLCISSFPAGTTVQQAINLNQSDYATYQSVNVGQAYFDFLDESKGFSPSAMAYRTLSGLPANAQRTVDILSLRDNLYLQTFSQAWLEYVIPSLRSAVPNSQYFEVDIRKVHDGATGNLTSATYEILNEGTSAGGGYVDGTTALVPSQAITGTSLITPTFNNATFTDQNTVAETNNNVVKTPSTADPVSTVTGNNYHDETDFTIKGRGISYAFTRTYNSAPSSTSVNGPLGFGWTHSYGMTLKSNDYGICPNCAPGSGAGQAPENGNGKTSSITYTDERGGAHTYLVNESTFAITPPQGEFDSLAFDTPVAGQQTLTFRNGTKYIFSGSSTIKSAPGVTARLLQIADPYGNQLNFGYDGSGRLSTVTDNLGISGRTGLVFTYDAASHLSRITDWSGRQWQYAVNANGDLASFTNPLTQTRTYSYAPASHNLSLITKPLQRGGVSVATTFDYYENGRTFNYADSLGDTETLDYDLYRLTTRVTDPLGNVREYHYDTSGRLVKLVDPDGGILLFANNATDGVRNQKIDALGFTTQYSYRVDHAFTGGSDTAGNVTRELDPFGQTTDMTYGPFDQVATVKDKRGTVRTTSFHASTDSTCKAAGKPDTVSLSTLAGVSNVKLQSFCWNADGTAKTQTDYVNSAATHTRVATLTYDTTAHLNVSQITLTGTDGSTVTRTFTYDNLGRKLSETLKRRNTPTDATLINLTTSYTYDALDRVTKVTDATGNVLETVYDANGQVFQLLGHYKQSDGTFVNRTLSTRTYDAADRLLTDTDVNGQVTQYEYDENGNLTAVTDPNSHTTTYEYDAMNRRTALVDANGNRTTTAYDLNGRVVAVTNADGQTTQNQYDNLGRLLKVTDPLGFITQYSYDADNNLTCRIDANAQAGLQPKNTNGCTEYRIYDELNRVTQVQDALNGTTVTGYDLLGDTTSVRDAANKTTTMVYDDLGRLVTMTDPLSKTTTYARDEAGNAYQITNRLNQITRTTFDVLNRVTRNDYLTDGTNATFAFDIFGNLHTAVNGNVTYTFNYDAKNRLMQKVDSRANKSLSFTYDPADNLLTKTTYPGDVTHFEYDSTNRLVGMTNSAFLNASYQYDPAGRLLVRDLSNGAANAYTWDADGRLATLTETTASGFKVTDLSYVRDRVGNIKTATGTFGALPGTSGTGLVDTRQYTYDALYRLMNLTATSGQNNDTLTYDSVGNRSTDLNGALVYEYFPNSNRIKAIHSGSLTGAVLSSFTYDDEGRMTSQTGGISSSGSGGYPTAMSWDQKGRMTSVTSSLSTTTSFRYDPMDYRIGRTGGTLGSRDYYLEAENLEAEYVNGNLLTKYYRGVSPDELVAGFDYSSGRGNPGIFHQDPLQTVTGLSGHDGQAVSALVTDPFGEFLSFLGAAATPPANGATTRSELSYAGRDRDFDAHLFYMRARYYDPFIGRFLSEDPLGFAAGPNFYTYANNNPVNGNDPSGKDTNCVGSSCTFSVPGAFSIPFPRPPGYPDTINSDSTFHHFYNVQVGAGSLGVAPLTQGLINNPTPGNPIPATVAGTENDATPTSARPGLNLLDAVSSFGNDLGEGANYSPVISYVRTDPATGGTVVLNVTQPGHPLFPGVVARYVSQDQTGGSVVNNVGEGSGFLQSGYTGPFGRDVNAVWTGQTQGILDSISSQGGSGSTTDANSAAAGGFLIYPNTPNNNSLNVAYHK
ncbi:MAG TPA: RHS repeat-associated core domain-containing protein [Steroidobacteraceae bacterium]|nr:RHS repeat-associated core domain-containing protein [Steroidobacteraceae bacterium]